MNSRARVTLLAACVPAIAHCGGASDRDASATPSADAAASTVASPAASQPAAVSPPVAPTASPLPIAVVGSGSGRQPIRLIQRRDGKVRYTVIADALRGHYAGADTGTSDLVKPHITFVGAGGKQLVAVAPAGTVVERDKTVRMTGGVHARSADGMTLTSDTLRYDDETQKVHGAGHVVVVFPRGERLDGDTVDWNLKTGDVEMNTSP